MSAAERDDPERSLGRHAIPLDLCRCHAGDRDTAVQTHAVRHLPPSTPRAPRNPPDCWTGQALFFSAAQERSAVNRCWETFDFPAASVILETHDLTGRERVPS